MRKIAFLRISVGSLIAVILAAGGCVSQEPITVGKYQKGGLKDGQIAATLQEGSARIVLEDRRNCGLRLSLTNNKTSSLPEALRVIRGSDDFDKVCALGSTLNLVDDIQKCTDQATPNNTISGCYNNACAVLVWDSDKKENESLFLHEYGHAKGLVHVCADQFLMNQVLSDDQFTVPEGQCRQIKGTQAPETPSNCFGGSFRSLKDLVSRNHTHGLDINEIRKFSSEDLGELRNMLANPHAQRFWPNVILVLGVLGNQKDAKLLIDLLKRTPLADEQSYRARLGVPIALAYQLEKTDSSQAAKYLRKGVNPEFWQKKRIRLAASETEEDSAQQLAKTTILSLGNVRSKKLDVQQILKQLKAKHSTFLDNESVRHLIDGSIQYNLSLSSK
jgi:hypothetical protein